MYSKQLSMSVEYRQQLQILLIMVVFFIKNVSYVASSGFINIKPVYFLDGGQCPFFNNHNQPSCKLTPICNVTNIILLIVHYN